MGEAHRPQIGLVDRHVVRRAPQQPSRQLGVALDGDDTRGAPDQEKRQRARPGTEIEDEVAGFDAGAIDEAPGDVRPQEVL